MVLRFYGVKQEDVLQNFELYFLVEIAHAYLCLPGLMVSVIQSGSSNNRQF